MSIRSALLVVSLLVGSTVVAATPAASAPTTLTPVLAYAKYRAPASGGSDIYTAHLDGSGAVKRFSNAGNPVVSPDGTKIAYATDGKTLWVALLDGSLPKVVATFDKYMFSYSWSPDDVHLVVTASGLGLVIVNASTKAVSTIPNSSGEFNPQWSPDGTLIASDSQAGQVLRRPDGSSKVVRPGKKTGPWSPDGTAMLTIDYTSGLEAVDVLSGAVQLVAYLRASIDYVGLTWSGAGWGAPAGYIGVDFDVLPDAFQRQCALADE